MIDETPNDAAGEEPVVNNDAATEAEVEAIAEEIVEDAIAEEIVEELIAEEIVAEVIAEELVVEAIAEELIEEGVEPALAEAVAEEVVEEALEEAIAEDLAEELTAEEEEAAPRVKPAIPGMDLEVDIVDEGADPFADGGEGGEGADGEHEEDFDAPIAATIELAANARYRATGKRKTSVARVTLKPGTGQYLINGRPLDIYFPRATLRRQIRQPLEVVGFDDKVDVIAALHGGGVSSQAGALRHGVSRALLEADPNLRSELKRRGFLTRDSRVKERKKAGLKKARKKPQFSKR